MIRMPVRRVLATLTVLALASLGAACSSDDDDTAGEAAPSERPSPTVRRLTTTVPADVREDLYLDIVRPRAPGVSDAALITVAEQTCGALDRGAPIANVLREAMQTSDPEAMAGIVGAAIEAFCPEYGDDLRALAD